MSEGKIPTTKTHQNVDIPNIGSHVVYQGYAPLRNENKINTRRFWRWEPFFAPQIWYQFSQKILFLTWISKITPSDNPCVIAYDPKTDLQSFKKRKMNSKSLIFYFQAFHRRSNRATNKRLMLRFFRFLFRISESECYSYACILNSHIFCASIIHANCYPQIFQQINTPDWSLLL